MHLFRTAMRRIRDYDKLVNISEIARRYFAMNAFDGVLTTIGVLMGNLAAGIVDPQIVVTTGLSTSVAMGVSGLWGAYLTESAERERKVNELSRYTLVDLSESRIGRASRVAVVVVAVVDGLSPALAALIVLIPFFVAPLFTAIQWTYYSSLGAALVALFGLGLFLGYVSRKNVLPFGIKTIVAGIVSIAISYLLLG